MKKTPKKQDRLRSAKIWIKTYSGRNPVTGYSEKYAVDNFVLLRS